MEIISFRVSLRKSTSRNSNRGTRYMLTIQERVRAGVSLLDEQVPNWWNRIDLDELDIGSCYNCVLGQLFGGFIKGWNSLRLKFNIEDYGFSYSTFEILSSVPELLTKEWKKQIRLRRTVVIVEPHFIQKEQKLLQLV